MIRTLCACLLVVHLASAADPLVDQVVALLPPGTPATVLLHQADAAALSAGGEGVTSSVVEVSGQLFANARQVRVAQAVAPAYKSLLHGPGIPLKIAKDHHVLVSFWLRAPEVTGGRSGIVQAYLERNEPTWRGVAEAGGTCTPMWRQIFVTGKAGEEYAAGSVQLSLHLGQQEQVIEVGGLVILDLGTNVDTEKLPNNAMQWPGMEKNAAWRAVAEKRIVELRQAPLTVRVLDADGKPAAGATVVVNQRRRACAIGSFTSAESPIGKNGAEAQVQYQRLYTELFDRATVPVYWADWGWPNRRDDYLATAKWSMNTGAVLRGHVLIYPGWTFLPQELQALKNDPAAMQARMLEQIRSMGEAWRGIPLREIDVTNELRDLTEVTGILGRKAVVEWFAAARAAFPGVKLALNENTILSNGGLTTANQDVLLEWYRYLKENGQAPDVIGFQGHFSESVTGPEVVWKILDRFAKETTAELQVTEFDCNTRNEAAQGAYTRDFLTACFAHPRITGITLWGFWQGDHWQPDAASWRRDWTPKPAGEVLTELLGKRWRTAATVITDAKGTTKLQAFRGELAVRVEQGNRHADAVVTLDTAQEVTLRLSR